MPAATERTISLRAKHADFYGSIKSLSAKGLREKKPGLVAEIRKLSDAINAEKRDFTAEEHERWSAVNEHYDVLEAQIQEAEDPLSPTNHRARLAGLEAGLREPAGDPRIVARDWQPGRDGPAAADTDQLRATAMTAWVKAQLGRYVEESELEACRAVRFNPHAREVTIPLLRSEQLKAMQDVYRQVHPSRVKTHMRGIDYRATLSQQTGASGAYLIPPETLIRELETNLLWYGSMRQVAETITTSTGERMSWPTGDDTTNTGAQLGENTTIGSSVDPTFGKVYWDAYKFSSKPVLVPYELLQDSAFNLVAWLGEALGVRLGRITNTKYTTGTGAATPKGLVTAASSFSAASATAIAADDLFGLVHSIDPAYRTADASFMMHDSIVLILRKLKDGTGRYLWEPGLQNNVPDRLLGYMNTVNNDMDSTVASGKKSILFGQCFKYKIRRVGELRLYHLVERYRDTDQDGFIAFIREDGNLLTAGTAPVKYLSH